MLVASDISAVGALSLSLRLRWEPETVFAIWNVYVDESGIHAGAPITLLGAFLSTVEEWDGFEKEWRSILDGAGVAYVHAQEMLRREGEFEGWCDTQINEFVLAINGAMDRHLSAGFVGILRDDDYRAYRSDPELKRERLNTVTDTKCGIMFRAFVSFIPHLLTHAALPDIEGHRVYFVVEDSPNFEEIRQVFNRFKALPAEWSDLFGTCAPGMKREFPGLQVTDMMVSAAYRMELAEHGKQHTVIEESSFASADQPVDHRRCIPFRIPITRDILRDLRDGLLLEKEEARRHWESGGDRGRRYTSHTLDQG